MKKAGKISRAGKIWLIVGVFLVVIGILVRQLDIGNWQKLDLNKLTQLKQTTVVFASDDTPIGNLYGTENRVLVRLEEVPEKVQNAFIAAEDQRFYQHRGVDPVRIFGALWHDIKTGTLAQGASTITQQLIKLTHLTSEKTFSRKAQEMWLAWQLERKMDKEEILECYLNVVYFGNGAYGIGAAAEKYFEKDVQDLTLAEGALLAGVIKSPTNYAPHTQPENAIKRRNLILDNMAEYGLISEQDAQNAKTETLSLAQQKRTSTDYDWYIDEVYKEAQTLVGMDADGLLTGGYRIYTALDRSAQTEAEALFDDGTNFPDAAPDGTPAQSALVAMDVRSGEIVALVGGRSYDVRMGLNRATQITRQPGSAIKPVSTYAAAIETRKYLPSSFLSDEEKTFAGGYTPGNADGKFHGIVTLREALSRSLNVATVNLADAVGIAGVRNQIVRFGIPLNDRDANLALSLGSMTDGVSPAELCQADRKSVV